MEVTGIEQAEKTYKRIMEICEEINKLKDLQIKAKNANDNMLDKIYADQIRMLKQERNLHDKKVQYVELKCFVDVIKTVMGREQYLKCWEQVHEIMTDPQNYYQAVNTFLDHEIELIHGK